MSTHRLQALCLFCLLGSALLVPMGCAPMTEGAEGEITADILGGKNAVLPDVERIDHRIEVDLFRRSHSITTTLEFKLDHAGPPLFALRGVYQGTPVDLARLLRSAEVDGRTIAKTGLAVRRDADGVNLWVSLVEALSAGPHRVRITYGSPAFAVAPRSWTTSTSMTAGSTGGPSFARRRASWRPSSSAPISETPPRRAWT